MNTALRAELRGLLGPVLAAAGFDLEDVSVARAGARSVVRVVVDRDGGVDLDGVADASRAVSQVLDARDVVPGTYVLEVTSPGVDRPLTTARHWRRAQGRLVRAALRSGGSVTGRVVAAIPEPDGGVTLDVDGARRTYRYEELGKATVQVEFARPGAPDFESLDDETAAADDAEDDIDDDIPDDIEDHTKPADPEQPAGPRAGVEEET